MDKPLALEYSGKQKWFAYEMFSSLKYDQSDSIQKKESEEGDERHSGGDNLVLNEQNSREEESKSNKEESIVESESSEAEPEITSREAEINSLKAEIKGLRNDFKFWMEKIATPLNIIANSMMANQIPKIEDPHLGDDQLNAIERQEINQSEVIEHKIDNYEAVREMYPYELFKKDILPNLNKKSMNEYSKLLKEADFMEPLAFYLYKNQSLNEKTKKSFVAIWREYHVEYKEFSLDNLKSFFIEIDYKKISCKDTLEKKWLQWRRIWEVSFGINKKDFPKIEFTSPNKEHKEVDYEFIRETVENAWNILSDRGKTGDALLVHMMYVLGLKTGEVRLLRFEDVQNEDEPIIKIYDSKTNTTKQILISQELYEEIIEYKNRLCASNKYHKTTRDTPRDKHDYGYFMFSNTKGSITKKFYSKFKGILKNFDLKPKDLREASINSMPLKSLVIKTQKKDIKKSVKASKKNIMCKNILDVPVKKSKRLKKR